MTIIGLKIFVLVFVTSIVASANPHKSTPMIEGRIIGGSEVSITQHSHQISLRYKNCNECAYLHNCGGSIINEDTILTAAHCVFNYNSNSIIIIAGSDKSAGSDGIVTRIGKTVIHELYNASITDYDIALIFLATPVNVVNWSIVPVPLTRNAPAVGALASITGWGLIAKDGAFPHKLQMTYVHVLEQKECQQAYGDRITASMFCAGMTVDGKDACEKDSGGPLLVEGKLFGVISWAIDCARPGYPGVYANVTHVRQWIETNVAAYSAYNIM